MLALYVLFSMAATGLGVAIAADPSIWARYAVDADVRLVVGLALAVSSFSLMLEEAAYYEESWLVAGAFPGAVLAVLTLFPQSSGWIDTPLGNDLFVPLCGVLIFLQFAAVPIRVMWHYRPKPGLT